MQVAFDVPQLYYLPQYTPVGEELTRRGVEVWFVVYQDPDMQPILTGVVDKEGLPAKWVAGDSQASALYARMRPDWVVFGNGTRHLGRLPERTKTALLYHGIGVKSCYYDADLMGMDVRFVEGDYRLRILGERYPQATMINTGFAKLDPLFQPSPAKPMGFDLQMAGLDPGKPTLLYAPTFFPSSIGLMADDWPSQFDAYNLIVKPHFFTFSKARYRIQLEKLKRWRSFENVYLAAPEDYSLVPFMGPADILISEASSAFFEFAALDKPIVWCDFYKVRWNYRGLFGYRLKRRLDPDMDRYADIGAHARTYRDLKQVIDQQVDHPDMYHKQRRRYTRMLLGDSDGNAAVRIADYLLSNVNKKQTHTDGG